VRQALMRMRSSMMWSFILCDSHDWRMKTAPTQSALLCLSLRITQGVHTILVAHTLTD
jgi:hypothetical protein